MNILKTTILLTVSLLLVSGACFAQKEDESDFVFWSADKKLSLDDFGIQTKNMESGPTSAQFIVDYKLSGLNFFSKNFNKKVRNYMLRSVSQIDTTGNVAVYLLYQQTLFDMSEVYTRRFRQALRENKKKLIKGTSIADEINEELMKELAQRSTQYTQETNAANDPARQKQWAETIAKELGELSDFAYEK